MTTNTFFAALSDALRREEARHPQLSDLTRISVSSLGDLAEREDEWYAVAPLYKLRFLCGAIDVNFDQIFGVPRFEESFEATFREALRNGLSQLMSDLYMTEEFWLCLKNDIGLLNLYPLQWSDDIATRLGIDLATILAVLGRKD